MSNSRFIKFIPSEESDFLRRNYPNAFLLLSLIAERARRISNQSDGLQIGDAMIGDHSSSGLSRQQHRTAIEKLVEFGHIEIVYNGKKFLKREKSTIKITIIGTLVNLKHSRIWDINIYDTNHSINQRATNEQPTSNHEQERIRKNKIEEEEQKEHIVAFSFSSDQKVLDFSTEAQEVLKKANSKNSLVKKIDYREEVFLQEVEYEKLLNQHGQSVTDLLLDKLNNYKLSSGKKYKSDYHAILGWVLDDYNKSFKSNIKNERKTLDAKGNPVKNQYEGMF